MANRKFIYVNAENELQEEALSVSSSAGAGDSGKLITLDASGLLDQSLIPQQSHSGLSGLLADDHTQYIRVDGTRAFTGDQSIGGFKISNLANGTLSNDAVNLSQLQGVQAGFDLKESVEFATAAVLPAYTGAGAGVGKTLTANANGALSIDGGSPIVGQRILIKEENAAGAHVDHGVYDVTDAGSVGTPWILTRSSDADGTPTNEVNTGMMVFVRSGTQNANTGWAIITSGVITVDTTAVDFSQFQGLPSYTASLGVQLVGVDFRSDIQASSGIKLVGNSMAIEPFDFAGVGLVDDGSDNLAIDFSTLFNEANKPIAADKLSSNLNGQGASIIGIEDSAGNFLSTNIEGALTELYGIASTASSPSYTVGTGGVSKGDLLMINANDTVVPLDITLSSGVYGIGVAGSTQAALGSVSSLANDSVVTGVLTGAVAGDKYYWNGSALSNVAPSGSGNRVWQVGIAKNATDLHIDIRFSKVQF